MEKDEDADPDYNPALMDSQTGTIQFQLKSKGQKLLVRSRFKSILLTNCFKIFRGSRRIPAWKCAKKGSS